MAFDAFLKIETVDGEATDDTHKGEIDVLSYSFGASQTGTHGSGGGGGAGKASFQDFSFVMKMNKATPKLMLGCATGTHYPSAKLTVRKAGGEQQDYLTITMSDVLVSSYQTGGSQGMDDVPIESITLNYGKIEYEYKIQKADGTLGSPVKSGYDIKLNKKL